MPSYQIGVLLFFISIFCYFPKPEGFSRVVYREGGGGRGQIRGKKERVQSSCHDLMITMTEVLMEPLGNQSCVHS